MFAAMGRTQDSILDAMSRNFEPWVNRMTVEGKYAGWITEDDGLCLTEAHRRGLRVVALHSSDAARPVYESFGFRTTNEMFYVEPVEG